ncbi:MAG: signal peptidase II [Acidobacteriota bacterium]
MRKNRPYFFFISGLLVLDQVSKALVARQFPLYSTRKVIPGFFSLTHIHNKGAIFGFFSRTESQAVFLALTAASLVALGLVVYYFIKTPASEKGVKVSLSLILAGAVGNLADRLIRGYVIDFLDFHIRNKHWPFFNVADSCITVGAFLLLVFFARRKHA